MQAQELIREFTYNSVKLADPNPAFTLTQVRDFFANVYPEIINADIDGPEVVGNKNVYKFRKAVGTKGGGVLHKAFVDHARRHGVQVPPLRSTEAESTRMIRDLAALNKIGWFRLEPRVANLIRISLEFVEEQPDFVLSAHHFKRIADLHAVHCSRTKEEA